MLARANFSSLIRDIIVFASEISHLKSESFKLLFNELKYFLRKIENHLQQLLETANLRIKHDEHNFVVTGLT